MKKVLLCLAIVASLLVLIASLSPASFAADQSSWVSEVRTGKAGAALDGLCERLSGTGIYFSAGKPIARETGVALANDLLTILNLPHSAREAASPCLDGKIRFENGGNVMDAVVLVLQRAGATPTDVATTPAKMRDVLLKDLKAFLVEVRRAYKAGLGSSSDYYEPNIYGIAAAAREWNLSPKEVGLNDEEVKLASLRR